MAYKTQLKQMYSTKLLSCQIVGSTLGRMTHHQKQSKFSLRHTHTFPNEIRSQNCLVASVAYERCWCHFIWSGVARDLPTLRPILHRQNFSCFHSAVKWRLSPATATHTHTFSPKTFRKVIQILVKLRKVQFKQASHKFKTVAWFWTWALIRWISNEPSTFRNMFIFHTQNHLQQSQATFVCVFVCALSCLMLFDNVYICLNWRTYIYSIRHDLALVSSWNPFLSSFMPCKHFKQMQLLSFVVVVEFQNPFSNIFKDIRLPSFCFIMFHAQMNRTESAPQNLLFNTHIYLASAEM